MATPYKNLLFRLPPCMWERAYFVSGMLVKRITRAVEECKLDITLACFLCKSTLRTSSVIGGHAPPTKLLGGAVLPPPPPPQFCCPCDIIKRLFLPLNNQKQINVMASWHHVIACLINLIVVSKKEIQLLFC